MTRTSVAAVVYAIVSLGVILFQLALAAGVPWGAYAMGSTFPGQFPLALRIAALVQAALLAGMALAVLATSEIIRRGRPALPRWVVWFVVAFAAVSLLLNLITPSSGERAIWAPIALMLLISSATVALGTRTR